MDQIIAGLSSSLVPLKIGIFPFMLWLPKDAEKMVLEVAQTEFGGDEKIPYWAILWPSAIGLAEHIAQMLGLKAKKVLELGAGIGLPSLVAAKAGADVLTTDWYVEALIFAQANASINKTKLETKLLDWRETPPNLKFDIILGADILYEQRNLQPVLEMMDHLLAPNGTVFLSDPNRFRMDAFLEMAKAEGWQPTAFPVRIEWDNGVHPLTVWEFRR